MNAPLPASVRFDVQGLVKAITLHAQDRDAFNPSLTTAQWEILSNYLQPFAVQNNQVLIQQGGKDRTLHLLEDGSLTVHHEDSKGRLRLAVVGPGSAVGEGAFFTREARNATVQAASACKVWRLPPIRFTELSNRQPTIALELALALGSLVARRLVNKPKRAAVT